MQNFLENSIFWVEVERIKPNPYQPRKEFDDATLRDLSESIRMYGILQPLVLTRREVFDAEKGMMVEYELVSGERRLRASKLAGLREVPAIIRADTDDSRVKLELAIIENLQREDLNAVDRARAFEQLIKEFSLSHKEVAGKVGRSREYVSNTLRILALPEEILNSLSAGRITDGHTRPLLMLADRPEEQFVLFKEILTKRLSVREAEKIARRIAYDRARKLDRAHDPELMELEEKISESLGTRVSIERRQNSASGRVMIDFFSPNDLRKLLEIIGQNNGKISVENPIANISSMDEVVKMSEQITAATPLDVQNNVDISVPEAVDGILAEAEEEKTKVGEIVGVPLDDSNQEDEVEDLYSISKFTI